MTRTLYSLYVSFGIATATLGTSTAHASTVGACKMDTSTLEFAGTPVDQARCLLRKVKIGGNLENQSPPGSLAALIDAATGPTAAAITAALASLPAEVTPAFLAARTQPLSQTSSGKPARYFVIHDTSSPYLRDSPFPNDLDGNSAVNKLSGYLGASAVAHMFVNRAGAVAIGHDFAVPWRATKLETNAIGVASRGRFLHVELIQPRRRDPAGSASNDRFSPEPGFSAAQYRRLAALYVLASGRAGRWLIPGFHAAIDAGLPDGHDDPQNFKLDDFAAAVAQFAGAAAAPPVAPPPVAAMPAPVPAATGLPVPRGMPIDEAYRQRFAQCDRSDRFNSVQFPIKVNGKIRWYGCMSDPSRFTRFEAFTANGTKPAAVLWEAKLAHDLDGSPKACNTPGRTDQCGTTLMLKPTANQPCPAVITDQPYCLPVNADKIPYIVMPASAPSGIDGGEFRQKSKLRVGDIGMVIANGKRVPVLIADTGPAYKIGEGSTALLTALSTDGSPHTIGSGVVFIAFPNTSPGKDTDADTLAELVRTRGEELYARLAAAN